MGYSAPLNQVARVLTFVVSALIIGGAPYFGSGTARDAPPRCAWAFSNSSRQR
jgi:hypothetical protein